MKEHTSYNIVNFRNKAQDLGGTIQESQKIFAGENKIFRIGKKIDLSVSQNRTRERINIITLQKDAAADAIDIEEKDDTKYKNKLMVK